MRTVEEIVALYNERVEAQGPVPTRYKLSLGMFIDVGGENKELSKYDDYSDLIRTYPSDSTVKDIPDAYAYAKNESDSLRIWFRPWPSDSQDYTFIYHAYTADLSADADTNWWTDNAWEVLLFGALIESKPWQKGQEEELKIWDAMYTKHLLSLESAQIKEEIKGSRKINYPITQVT